MACELRVESVVFVDRVWRMEEHQEIAFETG